jgi:hypothetical protein
MTAQEAMTTATHKARYGHRDQLVWRDRNGEYHTTVANAAGVKAAMLAVGTKGKFFLKDGKGHGYVYNWRMAVTWFRNLQQGYITP